MVMDSSDTKCLEKIIKRLTDSKEERSLGTFPEIKLTEFPHVFR